MRWIKTRHRMPPMDEEVLVWWIPAESQGEPTISKHDEGGWSMGSAEGYRVTHWMLIQEPAEEATT